MGSHRPGHNERINHNSTHYCYQVIAITIIKIIGRAI